MHPPLRCAATFSTVFLDGNPEWRVGSLFLDRPDFCFLRNSDGKIEEGRHLRLLDCVVRIGPRVFPDRRRLTLAPGDLSPAMGSPRSGSRFHVLADDAVEDGSPEVTKLSEEEHVAVQAASLVMSGDAQADGGGAWSVFHRRKSKEELVQEFWEDVGFPTRKLHVWELRASSSLASTSSQVRSRSISPNSSSSQSRTSPGGVDDGATPVAARQIRWGVSIRPWKGPVPRQDLG